MLAPHDLKKRNENPDLRPHIISNSYRCDECKLDEAIENLKRAGVEFVVAAGNSGPRCNSITHPADSPHSISIGALTKESDQITWFSSRGPVGNMFKPNFAVPGDQIRSCGMTRDSYVTMSGTSMASPLYTGAVAVLWSAFPQLRVCRNVYESYSL